MEVHRLLQRKILYRYRADQGSKVVGYVRLVWIADVSDYLLPPFPAMTYLDFV